MNAPMTTLLIALGGGLGAMLRFAVDRAMTAAVLHRSAAPKSQQWGIVLVNLSGSFLLGMLVGTGIGWPALSVGLLGGFTTFSTASLDSVRLFREQRFRAAAVHAFGTLVCAVVLALLGMIFGELVRGELVFGPLSAW